MSARDVVGEREIGRERERERGSVSESAWVCAKEIMCESERD